MTLRADIRTAYDAITPPAPALEAQIQTLVAVEGKGRVKSRHRRGLWGAGLRGTMALVAALLVVLIVATVLVGGRVWHDWNTFTNPPAPAGQIDPVELAALEARPLHMPVVAPHAVCPAGPTASASAAASFPEPYHLYAEDGRMSGQGPAYATNFGSLVYVGAWGSYWDATWVIQPQVTGLVLIRALDARNHQVPVVYVGQYAAGAVLGTDAVPGLGKPVLQRAELVLDAGHHPATSGKSGWGIYNVRAGISWTNPDCDAFQVDGKGFSEVLVVK